MVRKERGAGYKGRNVEGGMEVDTYRGRTVTLLLVIIFNKHYSCLLNSVGNATILLQRRLWFVMPLGPPLCAPNQTLPSA
jgi:hypothetical protein